MRRGRDEARLAQLEIAARDAQDAEIAHRQEDGVDAEESDPEMELAERLVPHPPGDLRIPVVDGAEDDEDRRHAHHHVEMADDEEGVGKRHVDDDIAEEKARWEEHTAELPALKRISKAV